MSEPVRPPRGDLAARLRAEVGRTLPADEFRIALAVPIGHEERAEALALIAWFRRRYPTPLERPAYVRRANRRWAGMIGRSGPAGRLIPPR